MECSHVEQSVKIGPQLIHKIRTEKASHWTCSVCRSTKSSWICLKCGAVNCGRYVNAHAKVHHEKNSHHCLCLDQSLAAFCYSCDEFVINDNKSGDIQRIRDMIVEQQQNSPRKRKIEDECKHHTKSKRSSKDDQENVGRVKELPGLRNLGNTCFMNAILQSLSNIQPFSCYFKELPAFELRAENSLNKMPYFTRSRKPDEGCLVEELRKVLCALWQGGGVSHSPESLFHVVWKVVPRFRGYQQQDAHEFMHYLLDRVHTELLLSQKACFGKETIVTGIFGGILQSEVTCLTCMTESKTHDPFLDLSLEIPPEYQNRKGKSRENPCQLQECMTHFAALENLTESEFYMCPNCNKKQESTKKFWIKRLPNVLSLQLKRFRFQSFLRTKLETYVQFPMRGLDMSPYVLQVSVLGILQLLSISLWFVYRVSAGHYTTFACHEGAWYNFNDSNVTRTDEDHVSKAKGYIFFYTRRHPDMSIIEKLQVQNTILR
ncbi:ubiquitin carboxyl-terminal hydrolase 3-like [Actinia tenebrosa]|uniref:ubiquitinyl hydrolase 1 n=1 Tax=Actinia tenebrosa TaxID=6105 RepID=A0A6P8I7Q6_ACTTE|nr:ubiquitin carboxyl-terminal hydrolase 3-like [Actinia tenebrosa]